MARPTQLEPAFFTVVHIAERPDRVVPHRRIVGDLVAAAHARREGRGERRPVEERVPSVSKASFLNASFRNGCG